MTDRPAPAEIFTRDDDTRKLPARSIAGRRWFPAPPWDSDEFDAYDVFEDGEVA